MATNETVTREIKREEWPDFFDGFSRHHDGWLARIEVLDEELGDQVEVENQALKGIVAERRRDPRTIEIFVGTSPEESSTHIIDKPTRVWVEEVGEGSPVALEIESEDHGKTILQLRPAAGRKTREGDARDH